MMKNEVAETLLGMREYAAHFAGDNADDLIQDTYIRAHEKIHLFTGGSLIAWLKTLMQRTHFNGRRLQGNQRVHAGGVEVNESMFAVPCVAYLRCQAVESLEYLINSRGNRTTRRRVSNA